MSDLQNITQTLISGDGAALRGLVEEALGAGVSAGEILQDGLIAGMDIVGERMESGEMFIPEVLMAAQAMGESVEILKPLLAEGESSTAGKVILGTVKGDLHDIGKNLVVMMMESAGFDVIDLGVDVDPEKFVEAIKENKPDIVGISALLTTTMPMMKKSIDSIEESGLRNNLKIIVGGAPVNQAFADEIGADGYAPDAGAASKMAKAMYA
ncbi:corrinoid methyltransferase [Desulfomarina profundi]|uniref:Corrinoid methyltransferase n=1 Tax=Desulfomarina profundi TaxID=2772557 RepID=A0A8D5FR71_9BACT|nr:corrinoid protein [Desulfomarina profundi]BCL62235.1 corrinoid methyltransferase [Desulfomarina profundi]